MLSTEEVRALQEIVGPRWVFTDPCLLDTYAFFMNPETLARDGGRWTPRPEAVLLPDGTPQVQEILRFCGRAGLMVKPLSTGFHTVAAASRQRVVILDLKRMNRILDIDVRNQVAIVEPYVRAFDLQTELFKYGLNVHIVSCGSNHSLLASHTAAWGYGVSGSSTSFSGRNLLGVEWVLPTGEVLTLGSGGAGAGWFSADGPGPSLRGVLRGFCGTFGGLGVFTRCALKLYKWDGPAEWETAGRSPVYFLTRKPERMSMNVLAFPSGQALRDAGYLLGEAEIDYAQFRTPMFFTALGMSENNEELRNLLDTGVFQKAAQHLLVNAVVGRTRREFRWKMRALRQVLRETGGVSLPLASRPPALLLRLLFRFSRTRIFRRLLARVRDPLAPLRRFPWLQEVLHRLPLGRRQRLEQFSRLFWLLIRNAVNTQATFRPSQGMSTMLGAFDTWDLGVAQSDWVARAKQPFIRDGLILDDGGDLGCGGTFENAHLGYLEGIILYNTKDPRSVMATGELIAGGIEAAVEKALGVPIAGFGCEMNARLGPHCRDYHRWQARIKKALDPDNVSDPFFYAEPEEEPGPGQRQTGEETP